VLDDFDLVGQFGDAFAHERFSLPGK